MLTPAARRPALPVRQHAFTLLEVLVTILIVTLALLGVAATIGVSLKNNQGSVARTQAVVLAGDIIDRMRANRPAAEPTGAGVASPYNLALDATPGTTGIPQEDLVAWRAALAAAFPSGTGSVSVDNATHKVTVVVQWNDSRGTGGAATQQFTLETRL